MILTAPHSTRSFCNKKEKNADLFTGAIVKYLGEENGVSTIIRTKFTPYKALISDWIAQNDVHQHYFLDIHGFNQDIDYDICLGIGEFEEKDYPYLQEIMQVAEKYGLRVIVNHPNYCGLKGLTGRYQKIFNLPNVIQMEIKKEFRDFFNNPDENFIRYREMRARIDAEHKDEIIKQQWIEEERRSNILHMHKLGLSVEQISLYLNISVDEVKNILSIE